MVETTRRLKASTSQLQVLDAEQRRNERENAAAEAEMQQVREGGVYVSRTERLRRWRLAKRQGNVSPYSGAPIGRADLFTNAYQIDHIVPLSRGGTNIEDNLVLCLAVENAEKQHRTPWEAWHRDRERWTTIEDAVSRLPERMRWRFTEEAAKLGDDGEGWAPRQIQDTSYVARVAVDYLRHVATDVVATKGGMTGYLRAAWQLPKSRHDHRRHFVDAAIIASTDRRTVQWLNTLHARGPLPKPGESGIEPPYMRFAEEIERRYRVLWPSLRPDAARAVADAQVDVVVAELPEPAPRGLAERRMTLEGVNAIGDPARHGGGIAETRAHFEHAVARLHLGRLDHQRNDVRLRDGLTLADRQRPIRLIGELLEARVDESLAGNAAHGVEGMAIPHGAASDLDLRHAVTGLRELNMTNDF